MECCIITFCVISLSICYQNVRDWVQGDGHLIGEIKTIQGTYLFG